MQLRREKRVRLVLLISAAIILIFLVYFSTRQNFWDVADPPEVLQGTPSEGVSLRTPISPETILPSTPGFSSPADQWAEGLIDRYREQILDRFASPASGGLVWWDSKEQRRPLQFLNNQLIWGDTPFSISGKETVELFIPSNVNSSELVEIASIENSNGILKLVLRSLSPSTPNSQWLISNGNPDIALQSLAYQIQRNEEILEMAFDEEADGSIRLILVTITKKNPGTPTPLLLTETSNALPTITLIPSRTPMPTPTRIPDEYLGRIIAEKVEMAFSPEWVISPTTLSWFVSSRPWIGILSWSETGPTIGGRQTAVAEATTLTIYLLLGDENDIQEKLVTLTYDEVNDATRISADQVYFQGRRMAEVLYWLFRAAAENDGQLNLAYDDFGSSQAITIIDFIPFD